MKSKYQNGRHSQDVDWFAMTSPLSMEFVVVIMDLIFLIIFYYNLDGKMNLVLPFSVSESLISSFLHCGNMHETWTQQRNCLPFLAIFIVDCNAGMSHLTFFYNIIKNLYAFFLRNNDCFFFEFNFFTWH